MNDRRDKPWTQNTAAPVRAGARFTDHVRAALIDRAEDVFVQLFGDPVSRKHKEWRRQDNDAFAMRMKGRKRGVWIDHKTGRGGDLFDLVAYHFFGLDKAAGPRFLAVRKRAAALCGLSEETAGDQVLLERKRAEWARRDACEDVVERAQRSQLIGRLQSLARPVTGTPAATYLLSRGISDYPDGDIGYLPPLPLGTKVMHGQFHSVVFWARNDAGEITGGIRIVINDDGTPINHRTRKPMFGKILGSAIRFPSGGEGGPICVAEGPETGLSIWLATGHETWAVGGVGFFRSAPLPDNRKVILCPDNDAPDSQAAKSFNMAVEDHVDAGKNIWIARTPNAEKLKGDLNDTLRRAGVVAVRAAIELAEDPLGAPASATQVHTLEDARAIVKSCLQTWHNDALNFFPTANTPAPFQLVCMTTGVGKSHAAREEVQLIFQALRAQVDKRTIGISVPRYDLAAEYLEHFEKLGIKAEIFRGRGQDDPETEGHKMCRRSAEAELALGTGLPVGPTLCENAGRRCPFYETCGYRRQQSKQPDVWIFVHDYLWVSQFGVFTSIDALIVDEDPSAKQFAGTNKDKPVLLPISQLQGLVKSTAHRSVSDLHIAVRAILAAASTPEAGRLSTKALDVTSEVFARARQQAEKLRRWPDCSPDEGIDHIQFALEAVAQRNCLIKNLITLLEIAEQATKRDASILPGITVEGSGTSVGRALRLRWHRKLGDGWNLPTICLSATASTDLLKPIWPQLESATEARVDMSNTGIRQIVDGTFAKTNLGGDQRRQGRIKRYIEVRSAEVGGRCLVVGEKDILVELGTMPENVETLHFGALSGLDPFRDVALVIILGRQQPAVADVEMMAELLTGDAVERLPAGTVFPKVPERLTMRGGIEGPEVYVNGAKGQEPTWGTDRHPDPTVEAIRRSVCETDLLQAIGRARGVLRDADTPLQIDLLTNVPLPLPVDEADTFKDFEPDALCLMEARGFMLPKFGAKGTWPLVAHILKDVFPSADAARKALGASRGIIPIHNNGSGPREGWFRVRAKPPGAGYLVEVDVRATSEVEARTRLEDRDCVVQQSTRPRKRSTSEKQKSSTRSFGRMSPVTAALTASARAINAIWNMPRLALSNRVSRLRKHRGGGTLRLLHHAGRGARACCIRTDIQPLSICVNGHCACSRLLVVSCRGPPIFFRSPPT